jgi:hypothetical protein
MSCLENWSDSASYFAFWGVEPDSCGDADDIVTRYLKRASGVINMAIQAQGACSCVFTDATNAYLGQLAVVLAVIYHVQPCARPVLTVEQQRMYLDQATNEIAMIRKGEIELCVGETGADFPAIGWAEQSLTDMNAARIIVNASQRLP